MGDRTTCNLYLYGDLEKVSPPHLVALVSAIDAIGPETYLEEPTSEKLAGSGANFQFHEVNYANMDVDLDAAILAADLSYVWAWEAGGGYGSGMKLYNAATKEAAEFATCDGEICLCMSELTPEKIAEARHWHDWKSALGLAA